MGGSLVHSKTFEIRRWSSEQFGSHHEVVPGEGGDYDGLSYTTWGKLKQYCATLGMDPGDWPDFTQYECCIDIPVEEIAARQAPFRLAIESLPEGASAGNEILARIVGYVRNGEQIFFC